MEHRPGGGAFQAWGAVSAEALRREEPQVVGGVGSWCGCSKMKMKWKFSGDLVGHNRKSWSYFRHKACPHLSVKFPEAPCCSGGSRQPVWH